MIIIPELLLHKSVSNALQYIREDYAAQSDKSKSYLCRVLKDMKFERYDYSVQGVDVFINKTAENTRFLEVDLMFNMERNGAPTIHITLPAEDTQKNGNGIGNDLGYAENIVESSTFHNDGTLDVQGSTTEVFTRRYQAVYNLVITSDNSNEVILIFHVLKALMTSFKISMHLAGLENISIGGRDLNINSELVPKTLFFRAIAVSLEYESSAPNIFQDPLFRTITGNGTPIA